MRPASGWAASSGASSRQLRSCGASGMELRSSKPSWELGAEKVEAGRQRRALTGTRFPVGAFFLAGAFFFAGLAFTGLAFVTFLPAGGLAWRGLLPAFSG